MTTARSSTAAASVAEAAPEGASLTAASVKVRVAARVAVPSVTV